jgi:hypothetical protein
MDRTKYERRLTHLNAYFSLAITLIPSVLSLFILTNLKTFALIFLYSGFRIIFIELLNSIFNVIVLKSGGIAADKRVVFSQSKNNPAISSLIVGIGILAIFLVSILLVFRKSDLDQFNLIFLQLITFVGGTWAFLWLERAHWEWKVLRQKVQRSEWVELESVERDVVPLTEKGKRQLILQLTWFTRIAPILVSILFLFPPAFMLFRHEIGYSLLYLFFAAMAIVATDETWKKCKRTIENCQRSLASESQISLISTSVPTSKPVVQTLSRRP